ncbi:hypothetical protein DENSPDRAFT_266570 [Dentipellis sp. KUC8613]|nr:hypothetical protein DENSPDRAFT_266570 [Dentipellis sp. KUC8613]
MFSRRPPTTCRSLEELSIVFRAMQDTASITYRLHQHCRTIFALDGLLLRALTPIHLPPFSWHLYLAPMQEVFIRTTCYNSIRCGLSNLEGLKCPRSRTLLGRRRRSHGRSSRTSTRPPTHCALLDAGGVGRDLHHRDALCLEDHRNNGALSIIPLCY